KPIKLDLGTLYNAVKQSFKMRIKSSMAIVFTYKDHEITLFNGGRMLIKNVANEETALKVYREIAEKLGLNQ
ncbi:MAG: hypothetical protein ACPLRY_05435, partial [Candidatus Bathyarchaeales archaeon]